MNAGGVPNTCKSNGGLHWELFGANKVEPSGGWVSNAWATCPMHWDNNEKSLLIPDILPVTHVTRRKEISALDGPASD